MPAGLLHLRSPLLLEGDQGHWLRDPDLSGKAAPGKGGQWLHRTESDTGQRLHSWALPLKAQLNGCALYHPMRKFPPHLAPPLICQQGLLCYTTVPFPPPKLCSSPLFRQACLRFPLGTVLHWEPAVGQSRRDGASGCDACVCVTENHFPPHVLIVKPYASRRQDHGFASSGKHAVRCDFTGSGSLWSLNVYSYSLISLVYC